MTSSKNLAEPSFPSFGQKGSYAVGVKIVVCGIGPRLDEPSLYLFSLPTGMKELNGRRHFKITKYPEDLRESEKSVEKSTMEGLE